MIKRKGFLVATISFIGGSFSFLLGIMGLSGFCCTVLGATILFYLGLASLSTFMVNNAWWLILLSLILFSSSIVYYLKFKHNKICSKKKR